MSDRAMTPVSFAAPREAVQEREAVAGQFGLIPRWATDPTIAMSVYNARSETVADKPSFRDAWRRNSCGLTPRRI
jgi:putative SOS response-associated peptidase YedK